MRIGVLALAAGGLGACSGGEPFRAMTPQYSAPQSGTPQTQRQVEDEGPLARRGGNYKLGQPYQQNGRTYFPAEDANYRAEGMASWYGPDFHGRPTANGEIFDMNGISAAHPTLPMPSYLRVTNLANGRSIIVRLNDRGPYAKERVVDLSIGAAKALDFYAQGLTRVRVEYVGRAPVAGGDDGLLMATLRHGSPAPAPSLARVAAAKPFVPQSTDKSETKTRREGAAPAERPFVLTAPPARAPQQASAGEPASRAARSVVRAPTAPASGEADPSTLGLISGRGLY